MGRPGLDADHGVLASARKIFPDAAREIDARLTPEGRAALAAPRSSLTTTIVSNLFRDNTGFWTVPLTELFQVPAVASAIEQTKLGGTAPAAPVYLYSGVNDEIVRSPPSIAWPRPTARAVRRSPTAATTSAARDTDRDGAADALNWLGDRIAGQPSAPVATRKP
ncbi:hypothetical protein GS439_17475 [Rhodococcus hoagii]|nr:hypothetical protein [Prescottella equi]